MRQYCLVAKMKRSWIGCVDLPLKEKDMVSEAITPFKPSLWRLRINLLRINLFPWYQLTPFFISE